MDLKTNKTRPEIYSEWAEFRWNHCHWGSYDRRELVIVTVGTGRVQYVRKGTYEHTCLTPQTKDDKTKLAIYSEWAELWRNHCHYGSYDRRELVIVTVDTEKVQIPEKEHTYVKTLRVSVANYPKQVYHQCQAVKPSLGDTGSWSSQTRAFLTYMKTNISIATT